MNDNRMSRSGRKSIPKRSLSINDIRPGVTFKIQHKQKGSLLMRDWRYDGCTPFTGSSSAFSHTCGSTNTARARSRSICFKQSDRSNYFDQMPARRPRSNSLSIEEEAIIDVTTAGDNSDTEVPLQSIGIGNRARKSSMSETGYGGSLSHLVPNRLLSSLSRRISVSTPHPGCTCASCEQTVTPYWRDGWSAEAMLCNACGLRFQKFARRCPSCVYIPRKEDSFGDNCIKCGTRWIFG